MDVPLMYHEFGYKVTKTILIFCSGCLENKISQIRSQSKWAL